MSPGASPVEKAEQLMADDPVFRAGGLASGLDTNSIIDGLTKLEQRPLDRLKTQQDGFKTQVSLIGQLVSISCRAPVVSAVEKPVFLLVIDRYVEPVPLLRIEMLTGAPRPLTSLATSCSVSPSVMVMVP